MTTLPQTTGTRRPHAVGPGLPASQVPGASAGAAAFQMTAADVWRIVRHNLWLIAAFLVLFSAGGFAANWVWGRYWPQFTAVGYLRVEPQIVEDPLTGRISEMTEMRLAARLKTEAQALTSEEIFSRVLANEASDLRKTSWFGGFVDEATRLPDITAARESLQKDFTASPVPDSELLRVAFKCGDKRDARKVLEELVEEHLKQARKKALDKTSEQTRTLREISNRLAADAQVWGEQVKRGQLTLAEKGLGVQGENGEAMFSIKAIELRERIAKKLEAEKEAAEARAVYASIEQAIKNNTTPAQVEKLVSENPSVYQMTVRKEELLVQKNALAAGGENRLEVQRLQNQIAAIDQQLEALRANLRLKHQDEVLKHSAAMAFAAEEVLKKANEGVQAILTETSQLNPEIVQLSVAMAREKELRAQQQQVDTELRKIQAAYNPNIQARIDWYIRPIDPDVPTWPRLKITLPAAILLGLGLALGIAFLREVLNDTVRSPRDLTRVGQMNLLGIISDEADDPQLEDARLAIFDAPHSITAEQYRQVRTRLHHATPMDATRSIMVTGPSAEDGKTTVAANLAAGLALNGRRVLLVDANFRKPELHRLFGLPNERGFSDVLGDVAQLSQIANATRIPNLAVLSSGPRPTNAAELLESQLLTDFIEQAGEEYDHIVFDTAPILVVAESQAMASRVDGVITVVRAHAESRGMLLRMRDALRQLRAEHIGVVLNAVRAHGGGYYRRNIKAFYQYGNEV